MAKDVENALKNVATQIAQYVRDAAEMRVETQFVEITTGQSGPADFSEARPAALTVIKLDGDSRTVAPLRQGESGLEVDEALFEIHERNVAAAINYRTSMLSAFLTSMQTAWSE